MDCQVMQFEGLLVAKVEALDSRRDGDDCVRLFLFRRVDQTSGRRTWTLIEVRHATNSSWSNPNRGLVMRSTTPDLHTLRRHLEDYGQSLGWHELVRAGAERDADLHALWVPVQIDLDLRASAVRRPSLRIGKRRRRPCDWQAVALTAAIEQLWDLGFVVMKSTTDILEVFPTGLSDWTEAGISLAGAAVAAKYDYRAALVVAVDGVGEAYVRTADPSPIPGAPRRFEPRPLTRRERREVERIRAMTATPAEIADWLARILPTVAMEGRRDG